MGQPRIKAYLVSLHETYRIAGWPIPTKYWTATHFTLFAMVQESIDAARTKRQHVTRDAKGFDGALEAVTGKG